MKKFSNTISINFSSEDIQSILQFSENIEKTSMLLYKYSNMYEMIDEINCLKPVITLLKSNSEKLGNKLDELFYFND